MNESNRRKEASTDRLYYVNKYHYGKCSWFSREPFRWQSCRARTLPHYMYREKRGTSSSPHKTTVWVFRGNPFSTILTTREFSNFKDIQRERHRHLPSSSESSEWVIWENSFLSHLPNYLLSSWSSSSPGSRLSNVRTTKLKRFGDATTPDLLGNKSWTYLPVRTLHTRRRRDLTFTRPGSSTSDTDVILTTYYYCVTQYPSVLFALSND
jgi:hypothetical protein